MKNNLLLFLSTACLALILAISIAHSRGDDKTVYSKSAHLILRATPDPAGKKVAEADRNEALDVIETKGVWYKVSGSNGEGWVYSGSVSAQELPKENLSKVAGSSAGLTSANASTGLGPKAMKYAEEHDLEDTAKQFDWAEDFNNKITQEDARNYLKSHNLGEYAGAK